MLTKRIIPCLDIKDGKTVKGINFINLKDAGDPVELGIKYAELGADELVFLDITATVEKRKTLVELVKRIAQNINIPFTVGGGINDVDAVDALLNSGADKITVNSSAVNNPFLIDELANRFGSQCVVLSIDTKLIGNIHKIFTNGGRTETNKELVAWATEAVNRGVGEILLTSMDHDGTKDGFAIEITKKLSEMLPVPVVASGGAGNMEHFVDVFRKGKADAALAASIFHFGEIGIPELKKYLRNNNIQVRL
ncbi:MAG: imidazole glycerol phosphate synthase subunit HisF [Bacteroidetes bacterium]|nr:imidazole glycerol phosphate synthase subunit HisF [Bacteroidota bacterium]MBU1113805.1 imidazole glycerol phosphate synthase subunit HisF [Bacteroidota bacterium]MBU1799609.1 imidazole glycerol phosphate synthase subunit HisF [Bacteroidota bacterium]